jgi:NAD(P)-dependent dehydrogenase (short-subunit alcohol dehydrogenase family)
MSDDRKPAGTTTRPNPHRWTAADIPDQHGRVAVITGANSGVGFETATMLAQHGAAVVLACRDHHKAADAQQRIHDNVPGADLTIVDVDLASLDSVHRAAEQIHRTHARLDVLINNAGLGWLPYERTSDGFELTLATNHLGHFALTGQLIDLMLDTPGSRIVAVTSPAHRQARFDLSKINPDEGYSKQTAYSNSKLANLLFIYELQRRLHDSGARTIALAAHPGGARTNFNRNLPRLFRGPNYGLFYPLSHPADVGALAILRAVVDPNAYGGQYYAPGRLREFKGYPEARRSSPTSYDQDLQQQLWEASERLTGVAYQLSAPATK